MGIIVDIIIIVILALSVYLGYRKGLVELSIKLFAFIIAVVVTLVLYKPVANFVIDHTTLDNKIENTILEKAGQAVDQTTDHLSDNEYVQKATENMTDDIKNKMLPTEAHNLAVNVINMGVILILFLVVKIALRFVTAIANLVAKLPILNQFNKVGGILYGLIRGLLIIYLVLLGISFVGKINPENKAYQRVEESSLGKSMANNNVLEVFLTNKEK